MSRNGTKPGRMSGWVLRGALALAGALPLAANAQQTVYWRNGAGVVNWWDGANPWYRSGDGWWIARPDYNTLYEASTIGANIVRFDNGSDLTMTINGAYFQVHQLMFDNGTGARTMTADGSGGIDMRTGSSTVKIENNDADAQVLNTPVVLYAGTEINPVSGNLTFNRTIYLKSNWINVWGNSQKYLYLNGQLNADGGTGGLAVKQDSIVVVTNDNTFAGAIWVEKGTVQLNGSTNAAGASGIVNVGTNATLDLQYGAVSVRPATLNLYGTGTNAMWGALRKTTSGATSWRGTVNLGADSRIVVTGGGLNLYDAVAANAQTLYVTNTVAVTMQSGSTLSGTKTTGDGALHKSGSGTFYLRPASGLTGSILLHQGEIRQYGDNSSTVPAGGALVMSNSTTWRSDTSTSRTNAKATQIDGDVTLGYSGGGALTFSGNVNLTAGQRTLTVANDVTISGAITNGGLTKAGVGTMVLSGANTYALGTLVSAGVLEGTTTSLQGNITNNSALVFNQSGNGTFAGVISGSGVLTNKGSGTVTLSGASTYGGATTVGGGTLLVSGSINNSAVSVAGGATLAGAGSIGTLPALAGTISPGNATGAAGTLAVSGGAAALGGGTYTCDIIGTGSTDCDKIAALGAVAAASTLTINLPASAPAGFSECNSYTWTIMSGSSASAANMSIGTKWASSGTFGVSASGNTIVVTHTPGTSAAPANLAATDGTSTAQVALSWDDVSCETGYVVWRHTANNFAAATAIYTNAANALNYNDTAATAGQLYYYWVTATNAGGSSAASAVNSGYKRLTAPANLAAADGSSTANVAVTWDAATGASTYHLYRDTDSDPAGATALGPQTSGYADVPPSPGQIYYYWVLASNSTSSSTSDWSTANSGYRKLATVTLGTASDDQSTGVTVTWTDVAGETGYGLWRSESSDSGTATCVATAAADATSKEDTAAVAGTTYYYWVRATNSTSASMGDFSNSDTGLRVLSEPSTAASSITFSGVADTSLTVGWTRGNGNYVLVVARSGSAPVDPTDNVVYGANAAFGSGDSTDGGSSFVVYKGTGTSVPVTGLSANTTYHFSVYEFNGATTPNYRTSDEPTASRSTLYAEPTTQATGIYITGTNKVTLTGINWTAGNGSSRLIVAKAGGAVDSFPVDGTGYTNNAAFGSGTQIGSGNYVVAAGTGPLATLSGLNPDVVYHFRAFEFNGSGLTANYLTSTATGNPASSTTLAEDPGSAASGLIVTAIGSNQFTLSWAKGTTGTNTLILVKSASIGTNPTDLNSYSANAAYGSGAQIDGASVVYNGSGTSVTVTALAPGTLFYAKAYAFNGSGGSQNYRTTDPASASATTLMPEPTVNAVFDTITTNKHDFTITWTNGNGSGRIVIATLFTGSPPADGSPVDGTGYTNNANFGNGTEIGVGNFVVYMGAGTNVTVVNLNKKTDYYFRIFEYNGTNATANYMTTPADSTTEQTLDDEAYMYLSPAAYGVTGTVGAAVSPFTFGVTNTGGRTLQYAVLTNAAWLTVGPTAGSLYSITTNSTYAGQQHTGTISVVGLAAGTYNAEITVTNTGVGQLYAVTNGPTITLPVTLVLNPLPDPTGASATADGKTMVNLAWTKNASYDVMIVYKAGSASTAPTQGTSYSVGSACGGGTVIYKGSGAALEHVVASGQSHYYAFYSYTAGNYYSAGATASAATPAFAAGEIVETFSYTNGTALTGLNGETGWGGAWYGDTALFTNADGSFTTQTNYPANSGNQLWVYPPDNTGKAVHRWLGQDYKSGKLYFGYMMKYTWNGPGKWEGLAFCYSNNEEKLFFGETGAADQYLGITNQVSSYQLLAGSEYAIVGYYDWVAGEGKVKAYLVGTQAVPTDEPSSWDLTYAVSSNTMGWINTIRLVSGASSGTPGNTYFDEVRIATNWAGIVQAVPTKPADPSGQAATADGCEMARLAWSKNGAANDVMILHKTSAIATDPTDGSAYSAGQSIGGATVIYKGSLAALEHVVAAGTTNFYKFYSYNAANYYSTGVVAAVTNAAYGANEKVNPFSYTNGTALGSSMMGGQGFGANFWTVDSGTWTAATNQDPAVTDVTPKFLNLTNYPPLAGNLAYCSITTDGGVAKAQRSLESTITTGKFYIAFQMAYQYRGANKWAGISLLNAGGTEKAFLGKGAGGNWSTLGIGDGSTTYWSAYDLGQYSTVDSAGNTGNVYLVVGKYDFDTDVFQAKAYRILDAAEFPATEPTSWDVSQTMAGIDAIARIQLNAGASGGSGYPGKVFYDEIRYGTDWSHLIAVTCPTWAGSNTLNSAAWTAPAGSYLGDTENFQFQSSPPGLGQSGSIEFDWARTGAFASSYSMTWWQNANNNSYWTNRVQMTTAGVVTSRFAAAGSSCGTIYTNNQKLAVSNLVAPSGATATRDGVNTNSQINLGWTRGISGGAKDTLIVRQTADSGWTTPVNGATYNAGDSLGGGKVVYRGAGTSFSDTGLAPNTTYYYRFYAENYTYYSVTYAAANDTTAAGGQNIVIDGDPADWYGSPSAVLDSSASSLQEYIWTDKRGEMRPENGDHPNGDIQEFRVFADSTWVYFLVKMTNIADATKPFVAIGVDTRTNSASTSMNWLGDDSGAFIGDGYAQGGAAHDPIRQINVHYVAADGGARIEMFSADGTSWYAPATGGNTNVSISAANDVVELKIARADLNLSGATTGRFTVASYLNTGAWNNDSDGTTHLADNTADMLDTLSIPPWGVADNSANLSAWLEDIGDADVDFWVDVKFGATGLSDNSKPSVPVLVSPTNTAAVTASPNLSWQASTDSDGQITGYLLEISTNDQFNGVAGTENGTVDLRVNLFATTTNYAFTTSATQYWWRVRARDTAGELSAATTRWFRVVGKLDTEGPQPTLLYIGTNVAGYLAGDYDGQIAQYGPIQSVLDSELRDTNNVFGFVLRWDDASGVYATNHMRSTDSPPSAGGFAFNIVSTDGRVSPNWDIVEYTEGVLTKDWAKDAPFYATNTVATGNDNPSITNYVVAAFSMTNYNPSIDYYLTVSSEDAYSDGGSWWTYGSWPSFTNSSAALPYYSGWCQDGPNTARNITTNFLIEIHVVDDDIVVPSASTSLGWNNNGAEASLVVSNDAGRLAYVEGTGQDTLYQVTDGALIGKPLSFTFNAYDSYYQGVAFGTASNYTESGRTLTNSAFVAVYWQTNWANYDATRSVTTDTRNANTMVTWRWPSIATQDVTALWGPGGLSGDIGVTNLIQLDLYDVDNDRDGDQANARVNFGRVRLVDDDATNPVVDPASLSVSGTGLAKEYVLTNLVEWTFPSGADDGTPAPTTVADNMAASDISHGPAGALSGTSNLYMNAQFYKPATNRYLTFTLTPAAGKTFKAESISYETRVSSLNGPDTIELYGTMPGGTETLWATNVLDLYDLDNAATNWDNFMVISSGVNVAMSSASTGTVTFKILARVADTNHLVSNDNANWYIDNLTVSGYILGEAGGAQITDRDLAQGTAKFSLQASDVYSGIDGTVGVATGRAPRVDFWNASSNVCPITNAFVTNGWSSATNATLSLSNNAPAAADKKQIALGAGGNSLTYYARFTVTDADVDRDGDWRTVANVTTNTVYDNDSSRPARGYLFGGPLGIFVDGALTKAVSSGNSREYRINDEQLQTAAATSIAVKVNLYDYSGWTVPTLSFSNSVAGLMSTNGWLTSVHTDDVNTTNLPDAAMEWRLTQAQAATLFGSYESITNEFRVASVWDKDDDRQDAGGNNIDNLELTNSRVGYLTFLDNDVGQANVQSNWSVSRTNWSVPKVYLGLPGDAARSNLYVSGLPSDTNSSTVLAELTNRVYDSQLAKVSAAAPLSVVLPLYDTGGGGGGRTIKGLQRGTALTQGSVNGGYNITNSSLTIGTVQASNATNYRSDLSSSLALTRIAAQFPTSTWTFASFSYAQVGAWLPAAQALSNHVMSANLYDADDNRPNDQKVRSAVALGTLQVHDNDTVAPVAPTNVKVNGQSLSGSLTRDTAAWTNQPAFRVSFSNSVDGAKAADDLEATGIGEYRTATDKADIGPDLGTPLAVPAEGALANYGFESGSTNWTLTGAEISTEQAYEGTHSVKMLGSTAQQTVYLFNTNGYAPRVAVLGAQYMGAGTVNLTVAGLDANGTPVGGAAFDAPIAGTAGQWTGASATSNTLATTVDRVQVTITSGAGTYWDDIRIQIELLNAGVPANEVSAVFTASEQGLVTNYLFAVDRDNNRAGDRKASSAPADGYVPAFGTAYDITPPTPVPDIEASTDEVGDPTTQFDVQWNPAKANYEVGPDNPSDANHPTHDTADRDVFSPWRSYKLYYGTFNPVEVPSGDPGPGNGSAYIYTNFIATGAYTNWQSVCSTNAIADPSATGTNYLALTNPSQSKIRLFDLDYDQDYAVIVVGVDKAGNEGVADPGSWATNNTIKFAVTQGVMKAFSAAPQFPAEGGTNTFSPWTGANQKAAALYWVAAGPTNTQGGYAQVTKDYDLIFKDATSFQENSNWVWQKAGTVRTNWFVETNALAFSRGNVRFYRASYKDRWRRTNVVSGLPQRPLASEEVYALHNVIISEGRNHVGLHGEPYTNTFAGVFGTDTNIWPAGVSAAAGATKIEFYSPGTNAPVTDVYWFGTDANWYKSGQGAPVTTNPQPPGFFTHGFSITLPTNLTERGFATTYGTDVSLPGTNIPAMVWHPILKVPTNGFSHAIACGKRGRTGDPSVLMYNLVALNLPVSVGPAQLNLPTNFTRGPAGTGDEIYTLDTTTKAPQHSSTIYCDAGGNWYFVTGGGSVPSDFFKPNDLIVVVSRNGGLGNTWTWTYHPTNFYALPTRWMGQ